MTNLKIKPNAKLRWAKLRWSNLRWSNLRGADLREADLRWSNLRGADLSGADLRWSNLRGADLSGADLREADLREADLREADVRGADLSGAKNIPPLVEAPTRILPDEGELLGWKKCRDNVVVKLKIPAEAKRSNATGRKCRAEYVDVLEVIGAEAGISKHDETTRYVAGQRVTCDKWDSDRWNECSGGIHFFITREECEAY